MKKLSIFVLIYGFTHFSFAQEINQKEYVVHDPNYSNLVENFVEEEMIIQGTDGTMFIKSGEMELKAKLDEFSFINIVKSKFDNNILEKTFIKDRSTMRANIMGEIVNRVDSNFIESRTLKFEKLAHNDWKIVDESLLFPQEIERAEEELLYLNNYENSTKFDVNYPEKMRIGDSIVLNKENVKSFYNAENIEALEGNMVLREVLTKDDETFAIFDIQLDFYGIVDAKDNATMNLNMEGTLERSLDKFYDKDLKLEGTFRMQGNMSESQTIVLESPATMRLYSKLK